MNPVWRGGELEWLIIIDLPFKICGLTYERPFKKFMAAVDDIYKKRHKGFEKGYQMLK